MHGTHHENLDTRHYTRLIAATGSGSLATSWGRPIHTVFGTTSYHRDGRAPDSEGPAQQWPLVMVTNVAEELTSTRARPFWSANVGMAASRDCRPGITRELFGPILRMPTA